MFWPIVKERIEQNWENEVQISDEEFDSFTIQDWRNFQNLMLSKSADSLHCSTWAEYMQRVRLSDSNPSSFYDTSDSLKNELARYQEGLDPKKDSKKLLMVAGTRSKLPFGEPRSGENYSYDAVENIENELHVLVDLLKIGKKDNHIGESFDNHLEEIDLLSDFGKSFLVWYLGDTDKERALLTKWSPKKGEIASSMTAAMIAGCSGEIIRLDLDAVINPRFIHLLIDDSNLSNPWWMEMALWASTAEVWKERIMVGPEDLDLKMLARFLRNALDPVKNTDAEALMLFNQDLPLLQGLLEFLEED